MVFFCGTTSRALNQPQGDKVYKRLDKTKSPPVVLEGLYEFDSQKSADGLFNHLSYIFLQGLGRGNYYLLVADCR